MSLIPYRYGNLIHDKNAILDCETYDELMELSDALIDDIEEILPSLKDKYPCLYSDQYFKALGKTFNAQKNYLILENNTRA